MPARKDETYDLDYSTFTDDGCKVFPKCLSCPLSFCVYEQETEENQPKAIMAGWRPGRTSPPTTRCKAPPYGPVTAT